MNSTTTITYPVSIRVLEATSPDPLNDEALIVVVSQPISQMHGRPIYPLSENGDTALPLYPLEEAGGSVVGTVLSHVRDASTVDIPPPPPIPRILPVTLPPLPLPPIPAPRTPLSQCRPHGLIPTSR